MSDEIEIHLLPKEPEKVCTDAFAGKPHDKMSKAIADLIKKDFVFTARNQTHVQILGIEGSWGSGKSHLLKMIEKKIADDKRIVFHYDLWEHQNDSLRKNIIWELVELFVANGTITKSGRVEKKGQKDKRKNWLEERKKIFCPELETSKSIRPSASIGAVIFLFLFTMIGGGVFKGFLPIESDWISTSISMLIIAFVLWIIYLFVCQHKGRSPLPLQALKAVVEMCTNEYSASQDEYTYEKEPTAADFRKFMKDFGRDVLRDKHLIIAFDNVDRISSEKIKDFFTFLHTFLVGDVENPAKITTIVTFDREHIKDAFDEGGKSENIDYANDYLNKTFDVVYEVPQNGVLAWQDFFKSAWDNAFKKEDAGKDSDSCKIVSIAYRNFNIGNFHNVRSTINFINELASYRLLLKGIEETVDDLSIALFILKKDNIVEFFSDYSKSVLEFLESSKDQAMSNDQLGEYLFGDCWVHFRGYYPDGDSSDGRRDLCKLEKELGILYYKNTLSYANDNIKCRETITNVLRGAPSYGGIYGDVFYKKYGLDIFAQVAELCSENEKYLYPSIYSIDWLFKTMNLGDDDPLSVAWETLIEQFVALEKLPEAPLVLPVDQKIDSHQVVEILLNRMPDYKLNGWFYGNRYLCSEKIVDFISAIKSKEDEIGNGHGFKIKDEERFNFLSNYYRNSDWITFEYSSEKES